MREVIMRYSGEGEDLHGLRKVGELVRCNDCGSYNKHDKRCTFWNHGQTPDGWCDAGGKKDD